PSSYNNSGLLLIPFFFSSRRRHTRSDRDWSSDVCSSDLAAVPCICKAKMLARQTETHYVFSVYRVERRNKSASVERNHPESMTKIGRASCRERVESSEVGVEI